MSVDAKRKAAAVGRGQAALCDLQFGLGQRLRGSRTAISRPQIGSGRQILMNDAPKTVNVYAVIGYEPPGGKYCVAFRTEVFQPGTERGQKSSLGLSPIFMGVLCIRRRGQKLSVVFLCSPDGVL